MRIFPAIDLRDGRVVRLTQGDYDRMQVYSDDPLAIAEGFRAAGATYLHVVDLDGAKDGAPRNAQTLRMLAEKSGLTIETGGGIRTPERVDEVLSLGVRWAILGTAALKDPAFLDAMLTKHGDKIAVGVDAINGKVAVSGWLEVSDTDSLSFCNDLKARGVSKIIYTDIAKDGQLSGTNLPAYEALRAIEGLDIVASGGISTETDIVALRDMGIDGAILGKALYEGRLDLARCIALAEGQAQA